MLNEDLLGMGVDSRVNRLMANRMALGDGGSVQERQCARRSGVQAPADLAGRVSLGQTRDHTASKDLITIQQALLRETPGCVGSFASF